MFQMIVVSILIFILMSSHAFASNIDSESDSDDQVDQVEPHDQRKVRLAPKKQKLVDRPFFLGVGLGAWLASGCTGCSLNSGF